MLPSFLLHLSPDGPASGDEPSSGREHRVAPRISCVIPVTVTVYGEDVVSEIRDISASGAAVTMGREVELGEVYYLSFALPEQPEAPIECAGLVRSYRGDGDLRVVGIEFHKLVPEERRRIADHVHRVRNEDGGGASRSHWADGSDLDGATVVKGRGEERSVIRWAPGLASLFEQVAEHVSEQETIFVPVGKTDLAEGEHLYLEVIPPSSHAVFRMLAEVVWVESDIIVFGAEPGSPATSGIGLRLGGLTAMDRYLLRAIRGFLRTEAEKYK